ncbi:MAG: hypothetical protein GEU28_09040 [Dehalococcoidia bacterium]|nr:hypothetical protein [Dehalococcoidia bacterium]
MTSDPFDREEARPASSEKAMRSEAPTVETMAKSPEERRAVLAQHVAQAVASGARVQSQSDAMAVVVRGSRVNHLLHFLVGVFTLGIWWVVWLVIAVTGGEKRQMIQVDEFGNVLVQRT